MMTNQRMDYDPLGPPTQRDVLAYQLRELRLQLPEPDADLSLYGRDFTAGGMCRWEEHMTPFRAAGRDRTPLFDEGPRFEKHLTKCRACRQRSGDPRQGMIDAHTPGRN